MKSFDLNSFKTVLPISILIVVAKATAATPQKKTKKEWLQHVKFNQNLMVALKKKKKN